MDNLNTRPARYARPCSACGAPATHEATYTGDDWTRYACQDCAESFAVDTATVRRFQNTPSR